MIIWYWKWEKYSWLPLIRVHRLVYKLVSFDGVDIIREYFQMYKRIWDVNSYFQAYDSYFTPTSKSQPTCHWFLTIWNVSSNPGEDINYWEFLVQVIRVGNFGEMLEHKKPIFKTFHVWVLPHWHQWWVQALIFLKFKKIKRFLLLIFKAGRLYPLKRLMQYNLLSLIFSTFDFVLLKIL